ncbi:hypothetical protein DITRI_Ditri12bG0006900 [Diplodiscus trichospermus]
MKGLTAEMEKVSMEQKVIKEGQRQVQHKLKAMEAKCDELRRETALVIQQSAATQLRLALMFQILQARQNKDFAKTAQLAQAFCGTVRVTGSPDLALGETAYIVSFNAS